MIRFDEFFCVFVVLIKFDEKWENRIGFVDYFNSFGILSTNLTRKKNLTKKSWNWHGLGLFRKEKFWLDEFFCFLAVPQLWWKLKKKSWNYMGLWLIWRDFSRFSMFWIFSIETYFDLTNISAFWLSSNSMKINKKKCKIAMIYDWISSQFDLTIFSVFLLQMRLFRGFQTMAVFLMKDDSRIVFII